MSIKRIPIIDLFAGPGGLGEGFTSLVDKNENRHFRIGLSIEKDEFAHKTLTLRSFLRQFPYGKFPSEYYDFLKSRNRNTDDLFNKYPIQATQAFHEAWKFELGDKDNHDLIDSRIRKTLNGEKNFVLIGGPPCQAYSLVGRARRREGKGLNNEDERVFLYREYYRILGVHQPPVFIMENVKGILSSRVDDVSIFKQLITDLQNPVESYTKLRGDKKITKSKIRYNIFSLVRKPGQDELFAETTSLVPSDFIIRSEEYGIPQTRHRVILLGIRSDIKASPELLLKSNDLIPIEDVLDGLPRLRSGISKGNDGKAEWKALLEEMRTIGFKENIDKDVWYKIENVIRDLEVPQKDRGGDFITYKADISVNQEWFLDSKIKGVINHESRSHIKTDLYRYLFASCFAKVRGRSPKLNDFPELLLPKHRNIGNGVKKFEDRFRTQVCGEPSKTITSHISKDGHYFIHPDPTQCRSLTVREAARIQTFPDNYFFCGPRTEQYHQVGNAVPPLLAKQIAKIVFQLF